MTLESHRIWASLFLAVCRSKCGNSVCAALERASARARLRKSRKDERELLSHEGQRLDQLTKQGNILSPSVPRRAHTNVTGCSPEQTVSYVLLFLCLCVLPALPKRGSGSRMNRMDESTLSKNNGQFRLTVESQPLRQRVSQSSHFMLVCVCVCVCVLPAKRLWLLFRLWYRLPLSAWIFTDAAWG